MQFIFHTKFCVPIQQNCSQMENEMPLINESYRKMEFYSLCLGFIPAEKSLGHK